MPHQCAAQCRRRDPATDAVSSEPCEITRLTAFYHRAVSIEDMGQLIVLGPE